MKNTKFRRRALLSSVAMLIVALIALGSATFAWFTSSTTATASGISIATTKSSELKVAKLDLNWGDTVTYTGFASSYVPASSTTGATWYTSTAAAKTAYTSNGTYATASSLNGVVYKEMLNIKNVGDKTATNVKITVGGTFLSNFGRIAIVPAEAAQTTADTYPSFTAAKFKANIYGSGSSDSWKPYNGSGVESTAWSLKGAAVGAEISVPDLEKNDVASYVIFVWFEGEDSDCYDLTNSNLTIGGSGNNALSFTVSAG